MPYKTYSSEQAHYIKTFLARIHFGLRGGETNTYIETAVSLTRQGIQSSYINRGMMASLLTTFGIALAPATLGASLVAAGGIFLATEGGIRGYRFAKETLGIKDEGFFSDITCIEATELAFKILFSEVASLLAVQYRYAIVKIVTLKDVEQLADYAADAVLKRWLELNKEGKCGFIKMSLDPSTMPMNDLKKLLNNKPACALFNDKLYYINNEFLAEELKGENGEDIYPFHLKVLVFS